MAFVAVAKNTFYELSSVEDHQSVTRPRALSDLTWSLKSEFSILDTQPVLSTLNPEPVSKACCADDVCSVTTASTRSFWSSSMSWSDCHSDDEDSCSNSAPSAQVSTHNFSHKKAVEGSRSRATNRVSTVKSTTEMTSLMLRNIPSQFSRGDLLTVLEEHGCLMDARFLYLPLESVTGSAFGYAFIAFASHAVAERFRGLMDGKELSAGRPLLVNWSSSHVNAEEQVERFRNSPLMHTSVPDEIRPIVLLNGVRTEFPAPTKKLRVPRQRDQQRMMRHASRLTSPEV